jgi:UDP:flavonoid glycosyltransferase YjiC (YdhE family)
MARIRLISVGSRGDLQPYLAILLELQRRGHQVTLIGSVNFQAVAEAHAVPFLPLPGDFTTLLNSEAGLALMQGKPVQLISDALLRELLETAHAAMEGTDLLLVSPLCLWGYHLAEATGCRLVVLSPVPIMATGDFPFLGFPASPPSKTGGKTRRRLRRRLNRSSYRLVSLLKWRQDSRVIQAFRRERLGLKPLPWGGAQSRRTPPAHLVDPPVLHLISCLVLPRPVDWKASASLTGFCFLEPRSADGAILPTPYSPDRDLTAFLENGPAPFYAGFGSMITRDPEALAAVVVEASQLAGARLILSPGWGRVVPRAALPADVFLLEECPHSWLFPRVQAAIHHGGAGTTATTLRYGIPSTVVAFFADQPAWGRTLERLGVSPATHRLKSLNAEALAASIRALASEPRFRKRAQELQKCLAGEDGVACTVNAIEATLVGSMR